MAKRPLTLIDSTLAKQVRRRIMINRGWVDPWLLQQDLDLVDIVADRIVKLLDERTNLAVCISDLALPLALAVLRKARLERHLFIALALVDPAAIDEWMLPSQPYALLREELTHKNVCLFDDIIASGSHARKVISSLLEYGAIIRQLFVIVDTTGVSSRRKFVQDSLSSIPGFSAYSVCAF